MVDAAARTRIGLHRRNSAPGVSDSRALCRCGLRSVPLQDRRQRCLYDDAAAPVRQRRVDGCGWGEARPCGPPFCVSGSAVAGARRSVDSLVGEQVGEAQGSRQGHQRHHVPHAGAGPTFPPAPHCLVVDVETADNLRPRQARLLLEPLQPLREVVGDLVGHSAVMNALSRH